MKKVLIGILILIPIVILLVVALVTNLLQLQVWIAVEDMAVTLKGSGDEAEELDLYIDVGDNTVYDLYDWVEVEVLPDKANRYTIEWSMSNIACSDDDYQKQYEDYLANPVGTPVHPAATMVDGAGRDAEVNTSGKFKLYAYCSFNVSVRAETVTKKFLVNIVGDTVHSVSLTDTQGNTSAALTVGESMRLCASYVPFDSKITQMQFASSDPCVSVDENGVITAKSAGSATVTVTADKYNEDESKEKEFVKSNEFTVNVGEGAGRYGNKLTLERVIGGKYPFDKLGISAADVDAAASENCTVQPDGIVINGEGAVVALKNGKRLDIALCDAGAIAIANAALFDSNSGYILGASETIGLQLRAVFAATLAEGVPEDVVWRSDNEGVATVSETGLVKGVSEGEATITATASGKEASLTLDVKEKATSLRLKTSNDSLEVGLARQTVFASDKYVYETDAEGGANKNDKQANSVEIHIHGEPEKATPAELAAFYERYIVEIVEGKEYAHIDADSPNVVVFDGKELKGKGVVPVKVKVYAKYPRFEANQRHTTDYVTLNVVYGVAVANAEQVVRASADQNEYILQPDNLQTAAGNADILKAPDGNEYYVYNAPTFKSNYAMVLAADIACPEGKTLKYNRAGDENYWCVSLCGDLYGNGHMLSAKPSQCVDWDSYIVHVLASGVTVSNLTLRHENVQIDTLEGQTFIHSYCIVFDGIDGTFHGRQQGGRIEYCILENTYGAMDAQNSDVAVDGCVFRNISSLGIYAKSMVNDSTRQLIFTRVHLNNCVFTSIIGPSVSLSFENFALTTGGEGKGRFSATGDKEESYRWVEENLVPKKYVNCLDQTGFLDIYNWQDAAKVTLVTTGDNTMDQLIKTLAGPMIAQHPDFDPGIVRGETVDYFHLGFISSGIVIGDKRMDERTFQQVSLEDDRFLSVRTKDLRKDVPGLDGTAQFALDRVREIEFTMYCYNKNASIQPGDECVMNSKLIDHLHEGK